MRTHGIQHYFAAIRPKSGANSSLVLALRQAHLSASEFAAGVVAIVNEDGPTPNEKYYKMEALAAEYREAGGADLQKIERLEADIAGELNNETYYSLLEAMSLKLQRRLAGVVKTVEFDAVTSEATLALEILGRLEVNRRSHSAEFVC